ncbi:MAG: hypothetical protein HY547_09555 [Elusimicrobia bacterium]|nr:hypothetical protein [Elusimicrobiota bacterium]
MIEFGVIGSGEIWRLAAGQRGSFSVVNTWDTPATIIVEVASAGSENLRRWAAKGGAPIDWFWLPQRQFRLQPKEEHSVPFYIFAKEQKSLAGKPLACYLQARAQWESEQGVSISPEVRVPIKVKVAALAGKPSAAFVEPWPRLKIYAGTRADLSNEKALKLKNLTPEKQLLHIRWSTLDQDRLPGQSSGKASVTFKPGETSWVKMSPDVALPASGEMGVSSILEAPRGAAPGIYGFAIEASRGLLVEPVALAGVLIEVE